MSQEIDFSQFNKEAFSYLSGWKMVQIPTREYDLVQKIGLILDEKEKVGFAVNYFNIIPMEYQLAEEERAGFAIILNQLAVLGSVTASLIVSADFRIVPVVASGTPDYMLRDLEFILNHMNWGKHIQSVSTLRDYGRFLN
ncbi:MAG: hypothetical protein KAT77_03805 [Nanoarchaeota archaeon]|nr:hypothetical protein [Nanoarchaeota archaeon]